MKSLKPLLGSWLPVALWCAVIFWLSNIPHLRIVEGPWDFILRKIAHLGEYALLARLVARALIRTTFWSWKRIFWGSLVFCFLYAGSDEYHQTFIAGRVGCLHDVAIDTTGVWLALGLVP